MTLNNRPRGLNSLLDNDEFGFNPDEITKQVIPVIDVEKYYGKPTWKTDTKTPITSFGGFSFDNFRVPAGERWLLTHFTLNVTVGSGEKLSIVPTIQEPGASSVKACVLAQMSADRLALTGGWDLRIGWDGRMVVDVDEVLGFVVQDLVGTHTVVGNIRYFRLTI